MIIEHTERGFAIAHFEDKYKADCCIQKSSFAGEDCIWLGITDPDPVVMASDAKSLGIKTEAEYGWIPYPIPEVVLIPTRMHLNVEQVKELIPILQRFVDTGEIYETQ